jgi:hypothetical protein
MGWIGASGRSSGYWHRANPAARSPPLLAIRWAGYGPWLVLQQHLVLAEPSSRIWYRTKVSQRRLGFRTDSISAAVILGATTRAGPSESAIADSRLYFLPPYSPELQPAEHLWPLTNQPLVNQCFADLAELEAVQAHHCLCLQDQPDLIRSATNFSWWPQCA